MNILNKLVFSVALVSVFSISTLAQSTQPQAKQAPAEPATAARTKVDETFDLNISERRITRENFEASTSVSTDGEENLNLQIGVSLASGKIDVLLRNVQGRVRFHGTLERILELLNRRASQPR